MDESRPVKVRNGEEEEKEEEDETSGGKRKTKEKRRKQKRKSEGVVIIARYLAHGVDHGLLELELRILAVAHQIKPVRNDPLFVWLAITGR